MRFWGSEILFFFYTLINFAGCLYNNCPEDCRRPDKMVVANDT
jgi:hypothetical protein